MSVSSYVRLGSMAVIAAAAGMFVWPYGIHADRDGNVWVADAPTDGNKGSAVVKFSPCLHQNWQAELVRLVLLLAEIG